MPRLCPRHVRGRAAQPARWGHRALPPLHPLHSAFVAAFHACVPPRLPARAAAPHRPQWLTAAVRGLASRAPRASRGAHHLARTTQPLPSRSLARSTPPRSSCLPLPSCEGRPLKPRSFSHYVSIHAPRRGATNARRLISRRRWFQFTPPRFPPLPSASIQTPSLHHSCPYRIGRKQVYPSRTSEWNETSIPHSAISMAEPLNSTSVLSHPLGASTDPFLRRTPIACTSLAAGPPDRPLRGCEIRSYKVPARTDLASLCSLQCLILASRNG